ncbi:MAG: hypothetical protein QF662_08660 [Phycisphaerae bacterium]|jgi:hypothetical protein|nr:hypothetical protein [Phycisphaerae bacterium]
MLNAVGKWFQGLGPVGLIAVLGAGAILAIVLLGLGFKRASKEVGPKRLIWWVFTSLAVGFVAGQMTRFLKVPDTIGEGLAMHIVKGLLWFLAGFVGLLVTSVLNGIFFGKFKVDMSMPNE